MGAYKDAQAAANIVGTAAHHVAGMQTLAHVAPLCVHLLCEACVLSHNDTRVPMAAGAYSFDSAAARMHGQAAAERTAEERPCMRAGGGAAAQGLSTTAEGGPETHALRTQRVQGGDVDRCAHEGERIGEAANPGPVVFHARRRRLPLSLFSVLGASGPTTGMRSGCTGRVCLGMQGKSTAILYYTYDTCG